MSVIPTFVLSLILATGILRAQLPVAPAPATPAQTETEKWFAATDAQWQAAFQRDVTDAYEAETTKLKVRYLELLDDEIIKAQNANDLDGALAIRAEQKRFGDAQAFPDKDEPDAVAGVKRARASIRVLIMQAEQARTKRAAALHAKYDQVLAQAQTQFTKQGRLDDALLVKARRTEIAAKWIAPPMPDVPARPVPARPTPATPFRHEAPDERQMAERDAKMVDAALASLGSAIKQAKTVTGSLTRPELKRSVLAEVLTTIASVRQKLSAERSSVKRLRREKFDDPWSHDDALQTLELADSEFAADYRIRHGIDGVSIIPRNPRPDASSKVDVAKVLKLLEKAVSQLKAPAAGIPK